MNAEEAQQWLQDIAPISGDPLTVLIPADQSIHAERPHQEITVPMRDPQGRAVLVATKMYQLGQTDVKIAEMQSKKIVFTKMSSSRMNGEKSLRIRSGSQECFCGTLDGQRISQRSGQKIHLKLRRKC